MYNVSLCVYKNKYVIHYILINQGLNTLKKMFSLNFFTVLEGYTQPERNKPLYYRFVLLTQDVTLQGDHLFLMRLHSLWFCSSKGFLSPKIPDLYSKQSRHVS